MAIGFGKSYQHVGPNRIGAYTESARTKGPPAEGETGDGKTLRSRTKSGGATRAFFRVLISLQKQRKRGLRILARKIRERVARDSKIRI